VSEQLLNTPIDTIAWSFQGWSSQALVLTA